MTGIVSVVGVALELVTRLEAVHDRHFQVEQDERRPLLSNFRERFLAVGGELDLIAPGLEEVAHHDPIIELVVDHQDQLLRHASSSSIGLVGSIR